MDGIKNKALTSFSKLLTGDYTIDELEMLHHIAHFGAICIAINKLNNSEDSCDEEAIEALSLVMLPMVAPAAEDYFRQMKEKD